VRGTRALDLGGANNRLAAALFSSQAGPTVPKQSLQRSGEKLAESAEKIKHSTYGVEDSAERTTQLAADRTVFAAERTYAAWVRTGLLALASGIGAKALLSEVIPQWLIIATGSILVLFSAFCFGAAVWRHLEPGVPPPRVDVSRIPVWILVAVNGFLALVALAALVGIWFGRTGV
jgi:putative membrane protein